MNHMHEALKRRMQSMKGHHNQDTLEAEHDVDENPQAMNEHHLARSDAQEEAEHEGSDLAPNVDHHDREVIPNMTKKDADGDVMDGEDYSQHMLGPSDKSGDAAHSQHMAILHGIADSGHMGRSGMSLTERAGDKAKEKIASIMKHKSQGKGSY